MTVESPLQARPKSVPDPDFAPRRRKLWTAIKLLVSVALIAFVLTRAELRQVGEVVRSANVAFLVVAFASYFIGYSISVARWGTLLGAHGVRPGFGHLYLSFMIGMFFNQLLPTTVGGDVARYHYTAGGGRAAAFSALVMDRVFGMVSLVLFAVAGLLFAVRYAALPSGLFGGVVVLLLLGLLAIGAVFLLPQRWGLDALQRLGRLLPKRLGTAFDHVLGAFAAFRGRGDVVLAALLWSLTLQCVVVAHYYIVGFALGLTVPLYAYVFSVPLAIAAMMLPISINGIGVRESVFVYLLGLHGVEPSSAVAFAWTIYALVLAHGLVGGVVFALVRMRSRAADDARVT